jgi:hypothetical protein
LIKVHEKELAEKKDELARLKAEYKFNNPANWEKAFGKGIKRLLPAKMDPELAAIRGLQDAIDRETKQIKAEKQQLENKKKEIAKQLKDIDSEIKAYNKLSASQKKALEDAHHKAIRAAAARKHQYELDAKDAANGGTSRLAKKVAQKDAAASGVGTSSAATPVLPSGYPASRTLVENSRLAQTAQSGDITTRLHNLHTDSNASVGGDPQITHDGFNTLVDLAGNGHIYSDSTENAKQDYARLAVQAEYALREMYQEKLQQSSNDPNAAKVALKSDPKAKVLTEVVRSSLASLSNPAASDSLQQEVQAAKEFLEQNNIQLPTVNLQHHNASGVPSCVAVQESSPATRAVNAAAASALDIGRYVGGRSGTTDPKLAQLTEANRQLRQQNTRLSQQLAEFQASQRREPEGVSATMPRRNPSLYSAGAVPSVVLPVNLSGVNSQVVTEGVYPGSASLRQGGTQGETVTRNPLNSQYSSSQGRGGGRRQWPSAGSVIRSGSGSGRGTGGVNPREGESLATQMVQPQNLVNGYEAYSEPGTSNVEGSQGSGEQLFSASPLAPPPPIPPAPLLQEGSSSTTRSEGQAAAAQPFVREYSNSSFFTESEEDESPHAHIIPGTDSEVSSTGSLTSRAPSFSHDPVRPRGGLIPTASTVLSARTAAVPSSQLTARPPTIPNLNRVSSIRPARYTSQPSKDEQERSAALWVALGLSIPQSGSSSTTQSTGMTQNDKTLIRKVALDPKYFSGNATMKPEAIQALQAAIIENPSFYSPMFTQAVQAKFDELSSSP